MGGHGGLNILPQKKWNVYRHDRQYQVKFDEHRDIEKKLKDKDRLKRERLSDSLVELRRRAQDVQNRDVEVDVEIKRRKSSSQRRNKTKSSETEDHSEDERKSEENVTEAPVKRSSGHINFFEKEEKQAEELMNKRREELIKSGHYIYNSEFKGPKKVNVFVDDENAKVTPDFKKQPVPWYMKPKTNVKYYSEALQEVNGDSKQKLGSESEKRKHRKTKEELRNERLSRESSERERALALLKQN